MKPLQGPSTDDIMPGQKKTRRCSPPCLTTYLGRGKEMLVLSLRSLRMEYPTPAHVDQDDDGYRLGCEPSDCCNALPWEIGLFANRV